MGYSGSTLALDSELLYNIGMFLTVNCMHSKLVFKPRLSAKVDNNFFGLEVGLMQKFQACLQSAGTKSMCKQLTISQSLFPSWLLYPFTMQEIHR